MTELETMSYGLHWEGPVAWLVQGRGGTNFVGLKKENPFKSPRFACNHLIPTAAPIPDRVHWDTFLKMRDNPVMQRMLPIPHDMQERVSFVTSRSNMEQIWFTTASRLSSPIRPVIRPAWTLKMGDLPRELSSSNVQPLVVTGLTSANQGLITAMSDLAVTHPRTIILTGDDSVVLRPSVTRLKVKEWGDLEDLMILPLENIGAFILRRYARNEDIFAPMESREDRRNRLIKERNAAARLPDR